MPLFCISRKGLFGLESNSTIEGTFDRRETEQKRFEVLTRQSEKSQKKSLNVEHGIIGVSVPKRQIGKDKHQLRMQYT